MKYLKSVHLELSRALSLLGKIRKRIENRAGKMAQSGEVNEVVYDHRILRDWSNVNNTNGTMHLSKDMIFNDGHRLSITVYR